MSRPGTSGKGLYTVDYDNMSGARQAVEYLIGLGRRKIATICGSPDHPAAQDRLTGWRDTMLAHGLSTTGLAEGGDFTQTGGDSAMTRLLGAVPDLDAVFAASDPMAVGALHALRVSGRRVPEDVAVIGFDDNPSLAPFVDPPLTSVHQDPGIQVSRMISMLMNLLGGQPPPDRREILPVSLTVRRSTGG